MLNININIFIFIFFVLGEDIPWAPGDRHPSLCQILATCIIRIPTPATRILIPLARKHVSNHWL